MIKILIIGGTRFLGIQLINILTREKLSLTVASRRQILGINFLSIDRKNQHDLNRIFKDIQYDFVVDFINYSYLDSLKLISALKFQKRSPKLILISSTYTYGNPLELKIDSLFEESSFEPYHQKSILGKDRPDVSYIDGKRDMESYAVHNYDSDNLVILRFPIILGADDYTYRTHFYSLLIKNGKSINPINVQNQTNYIFSFEAAIAIYNFIKENHSGIYNVNFDPISELDFIFLICQFHRCNINKLLNKNVEETYTPFTCKFNFIIDSTKYQSLFSFDKSYEDCFNRELQKLKF